ncbi:tripartite tricarboxylate transporter substrate binding protein [Neoroseomonas oryzicola]|uniref:Tripartite tricarboxylate transporter substrate binding protein n=1 Tax=Neoroseomonas oryzicola TaxID=535904 RepID=A0A9X9WKP4_9PROT|nr:tripartite tricarboxylate transporter substrate binding protein [Neoroseomonas oryzicola]MBR0660904.1 tripartite tricarboxylate transporter substrate binding protein [Neoroseomonas oryzicola]NKE19307.1 tripartite tricarboxylate transporter substrate binding protein [Neoroseomonas oryzicola]
MLRRHLLAATAAGIAAPATLRAQAAWRPERPVTLIVPWAAGGSTDQMARIVAAEAEGPLGQRVVVVNQPGASGSIGTRNAMEAAKDGYTWAAGAAVDVGCYKVLGLLDTQLSDWNLFFAVANVNVLVANPQSGFRDFGAALEALKTRGQGIGIATAGVSSAGHNMMEAVRAATPGLQYRHATYDGGNPAMIATVSGETPLGAVLLVEAAEMIRARRLIPLAVQSDNPVTLAAQGNSPAIEIPSVRRWLPNMPAPLNYFGIWCPKGVPEPAVATMTNIWRTTIANSQRLKDYATSRAALFTPIYGQQAHDEAWKMVRQTAWLYFDGGKARVSPDTLGIARL